MKGPKAPLLPVFALALACVGCGSKDDFSGSDELAKQQGKPSAAPQTPSGAAPTSHPGMMVPTQQRPPRSGG